MEFSISSRQLYEVVINGLKL